MPKVVAVLLTAFLFHSRAVFADTNNNAEFVSVCARSEQGELMIVVTKRPPQQAIAIYLRRWEIETLFSCLKTRGFCFESTT